MLALFLLAAQTFAEAKQDPSKRSAYLDALLGKLVYDKDRNPQGLVKAWYLVAEPSHGASPCRCVACARQAILGEYKAQGRGYFFDKEIGGLLASVLQPSAKILPYYREGAIFESAEKNGILLVGDIFSLQGDEEVSSIVEDYVLPYLRFRQEGIKVKDREFDTDNLRLRDIGHRNLGQLIAVSGELEKILKGRKVSAAFAEDVKKRYLGYYRLFLQDKAKEQQIYDDNNDNLLQKETVEALALLLGFVHDRLGALGHRHKAVDAKTFEYTLEKSP